MKFDLIRLALLPATLLACTATLRVAEVTVTAPASPMLRFALGKLEAALQRQAATLKRTMNQAAEHGAASRATAFSRSSATSSTACSTGSRSRPAARIT